MHFTFSFVWICVVAVGFFFSFRLNRITFDCRGGMELFSFDLRHSLLLLVLHILCFFSLNLYRQFPLIRLIRIYIRFHFSFFFFSFFIFNVLNVFILFSLLKLQNVSVRTKFIVESIFKQIQNVFGKLNAHNYKQLDFFLPYLFWLRVYICWFVYIVEIISLQYVISFLLTFRLLFISHFQIFTLVWLN